MSLDSISAVGTLGDLASKKSDAVSFQSQTTQNADIVDCIEQTGLDDTVANDKKKNDKPVQTVDEQQVSSRSVEEAIKRANNKMIKTHCEFSYNEDVNRVSITVYDNETDKVIREIPPEESLKMLQKLWEIAGLMVDEKR